MVAGYLDYLHQQLTPTQPQPTPAPAPAVALAAAAAQLNALANQRRAQQVAVQQQAATTVARAQMAATPGPAATNAGQLALYANLVGGGPSPWPAHPPLAQVPPAPLPPAVYAGGGSGVLADDTMGQRGPVVVSPQYRPVRTDAPPPTNNANPQAVPVTPDQARSGALLQAQQNAAFLAQLHDRGQTVAASAPVVAPPDAQPQTGNTTAAAVPVTPQDAQAQIALAQQQDAAFRAQLHDRGQDANPVGVPMSPIPPPQAPVIGGSDGLNPSGPSPQVVANDPYFKSLMAAGGTTVAEAMQATIAHQQFMANQTQAQAAQAQVQAAGSPGLDPVGSVIASAAQSASGPVGTVLGTAANDLNKVMSYPKQKSQEAIAFALQTEIMGLRKVGYDDATIATILITEQNVVNPWNMVLPLSLQSANDDDKRKFISGFMDAYAHGYTAYGAPPPGGPNPDGSPPVRPVVGQWGPGAQAAHEYLAGQSPWWQRAVADVTEDPLNLALPVAGHVGESLAEYGSELAAKEGASTSARVAGRAVELGGNALRVPDLVLNKAADNVIQAPLDAAKNAVRGIPVIGKVVDRPGYIKGQIAHEDSLDALTNADNMQRNAAGDLTREPPMPPRPPDGSPSPESPVPADGQPLPTDPLVAQNGATTNGAHPEEAAVRAPVSMTAAEREAGMKAGTINPFEPTAEGTRLVDQGAQAVTSPDPEIAAKGRAFETADAPKREAAFRRQQAIEQNIKLARQEGYAAAGPQEREASFEQANKLKLDQKIDAVQHVVADVVRDYKDAFGVMPEVVVDEKGVDLTSPRTGNETLVQDARTPAGNRIDKSTPTPDGRTKYSIIGHANERAYLTEGANDTWTVRVKGKEIDTGLSQAKAIEVADGKITPAGVSHTKETPAKLIEIAVYAPDAKTADGALGALKPQLTPEQFASVTQARKDLMDLRAEPVREPIPPTNGAVPPNGKVPPPDGTVPPTAETAPVTPPQPGTYLPPDIMQKVYGTPFTGASEPIYAGMNLAEVRDLIEQTVGVDQARAQQLVQQIADDKAALGLTDQSLYQPGKSEKNRPVIERSVGGRTVSTKEIIANEKALDALSVKYRRDGNILTGDTRAIANSQAARQSGYDVHPSSAKQRRLIPDLLDALAFRLPRNNLLADPIGSLGYSERNITSNIMTSLIASRGRAGEGLIESFHTAFTKEQPFGERVMEDAGLVRPEQYRKMGTAMGEGAAPGTDTPTRQLARKLHLDFPAKLYDAKKQLDAGFEFGGKLEMGYVPTFRMYAAENVHDLSGDLTAYALRHRIQTSASEITDLLFGLQKPETGVFGGEDARAAVREFATAKGADEATANGMADLASRRTKFYNREADLRAVERTNNTFPSRRNMTNLDAYASYLTMFHFWPTRTTKFVLEEMVRNPQLYHAWKETHQGLARMADEGNYPTSVRMLMYVSDSPYGFAMYANPVSLFLVTALQPDQPQAPTTNHLTEVGRWITEIKNKTGLGPTSFLDAVLNIAGVYGDAMPPSPWPDRTVQLAGSAIDYGLTLTGHGPGTPVYQDAMVWLRSQGSGWLPGTSNVPYTDQGAYTADLVASKVLDNNPDLRTRMGQVDANNHPTADAIAAQTELTGIMENQQDPQYVAALKEVTGQKLFTQALNLISPLTFKAKLLSREQDILAGRVGRASAVPTLYQEGARQVRKVETTTPAALKYDTLKSQYDQIGTADQKALAQGFDDIAYGQLGTGPTDLAPGTTMDIFGHAYRAERITALPADQRKQLADAWVSSHNGTQELQDYRTQRTAFVTANPEFGDFENWQKLAYAYDNNNLHQFRLDRAKNNPNFRMAMESYRDYLKQQGTDPKLIEAQLDTWAASMNGFLAAEGIKANVYDPNPVSTGDQGTIDSLIRSGLAGGNTTTKKSTTATLKGDIAKYNSALAIVQNAAVQAGLDPGVITAANPYMQNVVQAMFGSLMPTETTLMRQYSLWKANQPQGYDTGIAAFSAWYDALKQQQAVDASQVDGSTVPAYGSSGMGFGYAPLYSTQSYAPSNSSVYAPQAGLSPSKQAFLSGQTSG